MEAVESSIPQLDPNAMKDLIPKLTHIIRKGVGLPTKAGTSRYIVSLCLLVPEDFRPFADPVLQALSGAVADKSIPVRKSFAGAAGYVVKYSSEAAISRFISHLKKMYIENDDEDVRSISGMVFSECAKNANDATKRFAIDILPLAFFGSRDAKEDVAGVWKNVWDDLCSGSSNNATRLYGKEIVELSCKIVQQSPSWPIKKQVGKTFSDLCDILETALEEHVSVILPVLIEALGGRTWDGKESVLEAFTKVSKVCKTWISTQPAAIQEQVVSVGIREMRKNNRTYKRFGLDFVSDMIDVLNVDRFEEVKDYLYKMASDEDGDNADPMDIDEVRLRPMNLLIQCNAVKALGRFWPRVEETQGIDFDFFPDIQSSTHLSFASLSVTMLIKTSGMFDLGYSRPSPCLRKSHQICPAV